MLAGCQTFKSDFPVVMMGNFLLKKYILTNIRYKLSTDEEGFQFIIILTALIMC